MGLTTTTKDGLQCRGGATGDAWSFGHGRQWFLASFFLFAFVWLTVLAGPVNGQSDPVPAETESSGQATPATKEKPQPLPLAGPDTTIWIDDQGRPRPVLGISYEEFAAAWRQANGIREEAALPSSTLDTLSVEGRVIESTASLTVRYDVSLRSDRPIALPLGFAGTVLDGEAEGLDAATEFIDYAEQQGGYVAWLQPAKTQSEEESSTKRSITLRLLVPLTFDGTRTSLQTNVPRATQSRMTLETERRVTTPAVNAGLLSVTNRGQGSSLEVQGLVGAVELGWQSVASAKRRAQSVLSASGALLFEIDGQSIRTTANLKVESFSGEFKSFRLQFPKGAQLLPNSELDDAAAPSVMTLATKETENAGPIYSVTRIEKSSEPLVVRFETQQPLFASPSRDASAGKAQLKQQATVELKGFAVQGAVRQTGRVALHTSNDWRLRLGETAAVQRIDLEELGDELLLPEPTLALRYYSQPWTAVVQVLPRETRIEATPRYRLEVGPDEAILRSRIDYRIPGGRVFGFRVAMGDFKELTFDPIGPVGLVDRDQVFQTEEGDLLVPMKQASNRRVELEIVARCPLDASETDLKLRLPMPLDCVLGESELIVVSKESVQLYPAGQRQGALQPEPMGPDDASDADPSGLRTFRFRGSVPELTFEARKRILPQAIDAVSQSRFGIQTEQTSVEQTIDYDIRYQPAEQLQFQASAELLGMSDAIRFELLPLPGEQGDPVPLLWSQVASESEAEANGGGLGLAESDASETEAETNSRLVVDLPRPWLGKGRLRAYYRLDRGWPEAGSDQLLAYPLLLPLEVTNLEQRVSLNREISPAADASAAGIELAGSDWRQDQATTTRARLFATAELTATEVQVRRIPLQSTDPQTLVLKRLWIQTWQREQRRQQRLVFTIEGSGNTALFSVAEAVGEGALEVLVDGNEAVAENIGDDRIRISLADREVWSAGDEPPSGTHQIEIRYFEDVPFTTGQLLASPAVQFQGDSNWVECYWQVITPGSQEPFTTPSGFSAVRRWRYGAGIWQPQTLMTSADLEEWAGGIRRSKPTVGERAFLFSSFAIPNASPSEAVTLRLIDRRLSVLGCSLVVFIAGLLLAYLPSLRRLPLVLALATILAGVAVASPGLFISVSQASALGVVALALALLIRVLFTRSSTTPETIYLERASTQTSPPVQPSGADSFVAIPLEGVSSNAPTVSLPTAGPFASDAEDSQ